MTDLAPARPLETPGDDAQSVARRDIRIAPAGKENAPESLVASASDSGRLAPQNS